MLIKGKSVFTDEGKFKSDLRVLGTARMKEKLVVDSIANFKDKIVVDGLGRFNGDIKLTGEFIFGNNRRITYLPSTANTPEILGFGRLPQPPSLNSCLFPIVPLNQLEGVLQSFGNNGGYNNVMTMGFDGANGIIEMEGASTGLAPRLLINYQCGKDIFMNTGLNGGNVSLTSQTKGKVGVGTDNPLDKFQVGNNFVVGSAAGQDLSYGTSYIGFNAARNSGYWNTQSDGANNGGSLIFSDIFGDLFFVTLPSTGGGNQSNISDNNTINNTRLFISADGKVGINTRDTKGYRFAVNGNMIAEEIVVKHYVNWPDFVFAKEYGLMPLDKVEEHINKYQHLPNVPTEKEVNENGISLGKMDVILLQKIEELTKFS